MRFAHSALFVFALAGCRSAHSGPPREAASAEGTRAKPVESASGTPDSVSTALGIVASAKDFTLVADADAEPSAVAPFDPAQEIVTYAGVAPNLFAFR